MVNSYKTKPIKVEQKHSLQALIYSSKLIQ
jgi:hypothetical protein